MTNEEAIGILLTADFPEYYTIREVKQALDMAIKTLEQEPILDKIRDEIKSLLNANPSYWHSGDMVEREEVLDIIDKYKAESEEEQ